MGTLIRTVFYVLTVEEEGRKSRVVPEAEFDTLIKARAYVEKNLQNATWAILERTEKILERS